MKKAALSVSTLLFASLVSVACSDNRPILQVSNLDGGGGQTGGNDGPTAPDAGPQGTAPQSFVVHLHFTWGDATAPIDFPDLPPDQTETLQIDPTSNTLTLGISSVHIQSEQGSTFNAAAGFAAGVGQTLCGAYVTYDQFSVTVTGDSIAGAGQGHLFEWDGDELLTGPAAQATLTGTRATVGPSLSGNVTNVDPLADLTLTASEPLPPLAAATLTAGTDVVAGMPIKTGDADPVMGFVVSPPALRFGTTYDVTVQPWIDPAGNTGAPPPKVVTRAAPPLAPEDGFESAGATLGGTAVVKADILPPISGQQSLIVNHNVPEVQATLPGASNHLALRLAVVPGDQFVRFSVRPLSDFQSGAFSTVGTSFRVAVPGVAINAATLPSSETLTTNVPISTAGASVWMGSVRTVEIPLPAGASDEVVFDVTLNGSPMCTPPSPPFAYLIDDLRVE